MARGLDNKITFLGVFAYMALIALSLIFFRERTVFSDTSFHLFYILKDGHYAIQVNRFGAIFTQSYPLLASKAGLGLENIMRLYSMSFVLNYFIIFLLCMLWLKSYRFGLVMLLFSVLMITDTFYWIQSELLQGLSWLILFFGIVHTFQEEIAGLRKKWLIIVLVFMVVTLAFFHPLIIFPFIFLLVFFYNRRDVGNRLLLSVGVLYIFFYLVKMCFFGSSYEDSALGGLRNFAILFPDYFIIQSNREFLRVLIQDYYLLTVGILIVTIYYLRKADYKRLSLMLIFFVGYLGLINVSYPEGGLKFYMESLYIPLGIFLLFPLVFDLEACISRRGALVIIGLVLAIRIFHMGVNHQDYTYRLSYLRNFMAETAEQENQKLIISEDRVSMDTLLLTWGSSYEFWLLSTSETGKTRSIVIDEYPNALKWTLPYHKMFITKWGFFDYEELPERYFVLDDTTRYQILD